MVMAARVRPPALGVGFRELSTLDQGKAGGNWWRPAQRFHLRLDRPRVTLPYVKNAPHPAKIESFVPIIRSSL